MLEVFPEGIEERGHAEHVELAGYGSPNRLLAAREVLAGEHWSPRETAVEPGWETAWQRYHRPVVIGELWLGPSWETPLGGKNAVTIDPGMAFGTGAHPTTRLCIELLLEQRRSELWDLGCGSGVLAVVAARLGFAPVRAVDIDTVALDEARANAARNAVTIDVVRTDCRELDGSAPALVTANLPRDVLVESLDALAPKRAIVSGFQTGAFVPIPPYVAVDRRQRGGWEAALLRRSSAGGSRDGDYP